MRLSVPRCIAEAVATTSSPESMKMEIPVEAPSAGRISEIRVAEGQSIEEGDIVVVLD